MSDDRFYCLPLVALRSSVGLLLRKPTQYLTAERVLEVAAPLILQRDETVAEKMKRVVQGRSARVRATIAAAIKKAGSKENKLKKLVPARLWAFFEKQAPLQIADTQTSKYSATFVLADWPHVRVNVRLQQQKSVMIYNCKSQEEFDAVADAVARTLFPALGEEQGRKITSVLGTVKTMFRVDLNRVDERTEDGFETSTGEKISSVLDEENFSVKLTFAKLDKVTVTLRQNSIVIQSPRFSDLQGVIPPVMELLDLPPEPESDDDDDY